MNSISKKSPKNKDFSAIFMSREELELLVTALADLLDEYVDAIMLASVDEGFLTPERVEEFLSTQHAAAVIAEAFAPAYKDGGRIWA